MRTAFIDALCEQAERHERIWLVCGDLGFSVLERFAQRFPGRFLNAGVAEQNMTGIAAGLALEGKTVFVYSIANFPVMRCLEQVRNDVCYHALDVKIVAVGGGLAYGAAGYTHHGVEDLAVMRALPNMTVCAPGDPAETRAVVRGIVERRGPCYLRIGKAGEPKVHPGELSIALDEAVRVREGRSVALLTTGGTLALADRAAAALEARGRSTELWSFPTVQPLDAAALRSIADRFAAVLTLEEHAGGGFGSAVAERLAEWPERPRFRRLRLSGKPVMRAGSQESLRAAEGLSVEGIVAAVEDLLSGADTREERS